MSFLAHIDPLYALSGVLVGGLVGMTGVGGGALMTPILIILFGINPATAVGTDLLYASITKTGGTFVHGYHHTIDWRVVGLLALGSVPATALTIFTLHEFNVSSSVTQIIITDVLSFALFFTAISLVFRKPLTRYYVARVGEIDAKLVRNMTIVTGVMLGVLVSLCSVGAGAIGATALVLLYPKMPVQRIVGSDIAHAVPLTLAAGLGHTVLGSIDWHILTSLLVGSIPGIVIMSLVAARASDTAVRLALAGVLMLVCVKFWFF